MIHEERYMMKLPLAVALISLASCTDMQDYYPSGKVANIDGHEHLVRKLKGRENSYQAMENKPTMNQMMIGIDADIYARNVKAIEAVTGCKVSVASIQNSKNNTIAATDC